MVIFELFRMRRTYNDVKEGTESPVLFMARMLLETMFLWVILAIIVEVLILIGLALLGFLGEGLGVARGFFYTFLVLFGIEVGILWYLHKILTRALKHVDQKYVVPHVEKVTHEVKNLLP